MTLRLEKLVGKDIAMIFDAYTHWVQFSDATYRQDGTLGCLMHHADICDVYALAEQLEAMERRLA